MKGNSFYNEWNFLVIWFTYFSRLLNNLKAGSVKRINKLPGAIAGLVSFSLSCLSCNILTACSFFTYLKTLSLVNNKDACNTYHILFWFHEVWATSILTLTLRVWHLDYQLVVYYVLCRSINCSYLSCDAHGYNACLMMYYVLITFCIRSHTKSHVYCDHRLAQLSTKTYSLYAWWTLRNRIKLQHYTTVDKKLFKCSWTSFDCPFKGDIFEYYIELSSTYFWFEIVWMIINLRPTQITNWTYPWYRISVYYWQHDKPPQVKSF